MGLTGADFDAYGLLVVVVVLLLRSSSSEEEDDDESESSTGGNLISGYPAGGSFFLVAVVLEVFVFVDFVVLEAAGRFLGAVLLVLVPVGLGPSSLELVSACNNR